MQQEQEREPAERGSSGDPEPSTYAGGVLDPTTQSLDEMVSRGSNPAGLRDLEPITDSGVSDERSATGTADQPVPPGLADWEE